MRNTDILGELKKLSESADFAWVQRAAEGLGEVERGLRRNLLRSLSLDAFATALEARRLIRRASYEIRNRSDTNHCQTNPAVVPYA